MTCKLDACRQGRADCPCPDICGSQPKPASKVDWRAVVYLSIVVGAGFAAAYLSRVWS